MILPDEREQLHMYIDMARLEIFYSGLPNSILEPTFSHMEEM